MLLSTEKKLMLSSTHLIAENQRSGKLKRRPDIQEDTGSAGCCFLGGSGAKKKGKKSKKKSKAQAQRESEKSLNSSTISINECKHTGKQGDVCSEC